ncbi:hypothetical protein IHQ68_08075 [Chelatococcus sambhunathii]|uniref:Uncharacterized protein n=1 Tax=Chelatococcus sambhunathii TaxID=363953 RepID=A0ABU1DER0_9HYPH|nr:hypothetical protein [Chelatococcus sambhunathii]MDR4306572.1 hypothetical protein [Chelatococcus sambhunathii]
MLAARDITVEIGGDVVRLRPTLRAAMRLERDFGFPKLLKLLSEGSVTATSAILAEHANPFPAVSIANAIRLAPDLIAHVLRLAGASDEPAPKGKPAGKAMSHAAYFDRLFALGTGALGWTAQATLDTPAAEIEAAYAGRVELLSSIFGGKSEDDAAPTSAERDPNAASILRMLA